MNCMEKVWGMHAWWNYPLCIQCCNKECLPFNTTLVLQGFIPGFLVTRARSLFNVILPEEKWTKFSCGEIRLWQDLSAKEPMLCTAPCSQVGFPLREGGCRHHGPLLFKASVSATHFRQMGSVREGNTLCLFNLHVCSYFQWVIHHTDTFPKNVYLSLLWCFHKRSVVVFLWCFVGKQVQR